jgi:predicted ribosome quality control (RQC) complex YloA/Tae2 family protein
MDQHSYQADKSLQAAGLSPESIQAIKSTTVITRDGIQHVVPQSQAHLHEASSGAVATDTALGQQIQDVSRMLARHKQFSDQRIMKLEQHMEKLLATVKNQEQTIQTLRSNQAAQRKQAQTLQQTYAQEAKEEKTREIKSTTQAPTQAIDRNKVAPADVQVENIFYSGSRR